VGDGFPKIKRIIQESRTIICIRIEGVAYLILSKRSVFLILCSILVFNTAGIGLVVYLPKYLDEFLFIEKPVIQLIATIFPLSLFVFPPLIGKYSDKLQNRNAFVLIGASGIILSFILFLFTQNLLLIVLLSLLYGFFGASYRTIFTLYAELVDNNTRYISYYNAVSTCGWFLGSQLGGIFIDVYGIQNIFFFLILFSIINLSSVLFLKENRSLILRHYEKASAESNNDIDKGNTVSFSIYLGLFFRNFGIKPIMVILSIIMGFHISSDTQVGFLIGLNFLIQVALMLIIGHIITVKNEKIILILGYIFSTIAIIGYIISYNFFSFLISQVFIALSYSMFWSATVMYIAQNSTPKNKGRYMGYANSSTFSGGFIGGLLFSYLLLAFNSNYYSAMYFMIIFPVLSSISILLKFKPRSKPKLINK
jgi:DHA1 family multidrug resistance protein-like MFS transporter